jgi:kumamolisin
VASNGKIVSETAWNERNAEPGKAISDVFALPDWQRGVSSTPTKSPNNGRAVPDVSAHANPDSGYRIFLHGSEIVMGGTTTSTALWAGLIALLNQGVGRNLGLVNPLLYQTIGPSAILRAITPDKKSGGDHPASHTPEGWHAGTGWGSPNGQRLLEALVSERKS